MPDKESAIKRSGRRGAYAKGVLINLALSKDTKFWEVNRIEKPAPSLKKDATDKQILSNGNITDINKRRNAKNKIINDIKKELQNEVVVSEPLVKKDNETERDFKIRQARQEKEALKISNYAIYRREKDKTEEFKFTVKAQARLTTAKAEAKSRESLDAKSRELRANEDKSEGKIYDSIRNLKADHRTAININGTFIDLDKIEQVTTTGRHIPASSNIIKESEAQKDKDGNIKLAKDEVILGKNEQRTGYIISTDTIKPGLISSVTGKMQVTVSTEIRKSETIRTKRVIGAPPSEGKLDYDQEFAVEKTIGSKHIYRQSNRLYLYREGTELIVGLKDKEGNVLYNTDIGLLLANAFQKTGTKEIYINNISFTESDFVKGFDGRWRLQELAVTELNAPEIEGRVSARLSNTYQQQFKVLSETVKALRPEKAPQKVYGEMQSTTIPTEDGTEANGAILVYFSIDARAAMIELAKAGEAHSVVATSFTIKKEGNRLVVGLDKIEKNGSTGKENFYGLVFKNDSIQGFYALDKFLIIGFKEGRCMITLISPDMKYEGFTNSNLPKYP